MPSIKVGGMSCQGCVGAVTKALMGVPGVSHIEVSLEQGMARFQAPADLDWEVVRAAIQRAGFTASEPSAQ